MTTSSTPNDQNKFKKNSILRSSLQDALAGATAGAIAKTATAPIERVKLIMQLRRSIIVDDTKIPSSSSNNHNNYSTMRNVVKSIYIEEGFAAFWRGK
jgi:solute carrier family 25 (adenine nucleotide translocator) protein 4/5/6/31